MDRIRKWKDTKPINYNELVFRENVLAFKHGYTQGHKLILKRFRPLMDDDLVKILEGKIVDFDLNNFSRCEDLDDLLVAYKSKLTTLENEFCEEVE
jgi:hypothetical protein